MILERVLNDTSTRVEAQLNRILDELEQFPFDSYKGIPLKDLIVAGLAKLEENSIAATFENITVTMYKLFPERFALVGFPQYPDSDRVDNTLRLDARKAGYVTGHKQRTNQWQLTAQGRKAYIELALRMKSNPIRTNVESTKFRSSAIRYVKEVQQSPAFVKWASHKMKSMTRFEICDVLHGTLDTSRLKLWRDLGDLIEYSKTAETTEEYHESAVNVSTFLSYLKQNWEMLMNA